MQHLAHWTDEELIAVLYDRKENLLIRRLRHEAAMELNRRALNDHRKDHRVKALVSPVPTA